MLGITVIGAIMTGRQESLVRVGDNPLGAFLGAFLGGYQRGIVVVAVLVLRGAFAWAALRKASYDSGALRVRV